MSWLNKNSFLGVLIFATTLIVGFESWLLWRARVDAVHALAGLDQKKREREDLQQRLPQPTGDTAHAIDADLAGAATKLAVARSAFFKATDQDAAAGSGKSIDAYFEIARFVEAQRAAAKRLAIAIKADEHFGFRSHATEGPDAQILPAVLSQRVAIGKLCGALFTAGPAALISVQRERPAALLQHRSQDDGRLQKNVRAKPETRREEATDFFEAVPSLSLRVSGKIEVSAFKVEFSGATRVLRDFLNVLAGSETPFFVRSVEVEPLADLPKASIVSGASSAPIPIVTDSLSRFRVTIELLESADQIEGITR